MVRLGSVGAALALMALFGGAAVGQEQQGERERLLARISEVKQDPARFEASVEAGRERTLLCSSCHGSDGNSTSPEVPNLAGQNAIYLLEQIEKFSDGRRKNFVMERLARSFTPEDKVNLAIFYSTSQVKPAVADEQLAQDGKRLFQNVCQTCHGVNGRGEQGYARIAGQKVDYMITTLHRFRDNAQHLVPEKEMKRHSMLMEQVAQDLSDRDIEALANYIALLK